MNPLRKPWLEKRAVFTWLSPYYMSNATKGIKSNIASRGKNVITCMCVCVLDKDCWDPLRLHRSWLWLLPLGPPVSFPFWGGSVLRHQSAAKHTDVKNDTQANPSTPTAYHFTVFYRCPYVTDAALFGNRLGCCFGAATISLLPCYALCSNGSAFGVFGLRHAFRCIVA